MILAPKPGGRMICLILLLATATAPASAPASRESNVPRIMAELRSEIASLNAEIESLRQQLADAQAEVSKARKKLERVAEPVGSDADKINDAIHRHKIVVGMTFAQAKLSLDGNGWSGPRVVSEVDKVTTYEWTWTGEAIRDATGRSHNPQKTVQASIENGKVVAVFNP